MQAESEIETTEITPVIVRPKDTQVGMVQLNESPQEIAKKFEQYEELRSLILKEDDFYPIKGGGQGVGKTGLYKLGVAFNLDTLIVNETRVTKADAPDYIGYKFTVQCNASNGRMVMEVGFCDNTPKDRHGESEHIIRAMAKTRATERAYGVMTGETGKKGDYKTTEKTPPICKCSEPKTGVDGMCKTCGAVDKKYYEHHRDEFK